MDRITVVGGGLAGICAAIAASEAGASVRLLERGAQLGGRARSLEGDYRANLGPHVIYKDGPFFAWMRERDLMPPIAGPPLSGLRFHWQGELRRSPPLGSLPSVLRLRGREAPHDRPFADWAAEHTDETTARMLSAAAGVYTFHHDPGGLSAAFVWSRNVRVLLTPPPRARYVIGGWSAMVDRLGVRMRELGVSVETEHPVDALPEPPVIVATELREAAALLGDPTLTWPSGRTVCLDLALRERRGDPFVVSDLDDAGWIERYTAADPSLAPAGEELLQAQMPLCPDEGPDEATARLERLLAVAYPDCRERTIWRRRLVMEGRTGALDHPGTTWRDRPAIERGDGVFLAGDRVAADGLLSEVSWASGIRAGALAVERADLRPRAAA